jgi:hypothetical protein
VPRAFWVVLVCGLGLMCLAGAGLVAIAPTAAESFRRRALHDGFVRGFRDALELPDADEARLAELAWQAFASLHARDTALEDIDPGMALADGVGRIDDSMVLDLHEIRVELAHTDRAICSGQWTGLLDGNTVHRALSLMPDRSVVRYFHGTFGAMVASADGLPARISAEEAVTLNDSLWARAAGANGSSAITGAIEAGNAVTDEQACAAMVELYAFIDAEPAPERLRDARALLVVLMAPEDVE